MKTYWCRASFVTANIAFTYASSTIRKCSSVQPFISNSFLIRTYSVSHVRIQCPTLALQSYSSLSPVSSFSSPLSSSIPFVVSFSSLSSFCIPKVEATTRTAPDALLNPLPLTSFPAGVCQKGRCPSVCVSAKGTQQKTRGWIKNPKEQDKTQTGLNQYAARYVVRLEGIDRYLWKSLY
eukprot:g9513.t1